MLAALLVSQLFHFSCSYIPIVGGMRATEKSIDQHLKQVEMHGFVMRLHIPFV